MPTIFECEGMPTQDLGISVLYGWDRSIRVHRQPSAARQGTNQESEQNLHA
jgi:hypothetical protein